MPKRYVKLLGVSLKEKLEEMSEGSHHDVVNLYEEIAISRLAAMQAIKLASPVLDGTTELEPHVRVLALSCLQDAMEHVRRMVLSAARIEKSVDGRVSLQVIDLLFMQVIRVVHEACPDEELAEKIEAGIREIKLPVHSKNAGASLMDGIDSTPDMMVGEMDESVCGDDDV